MQKYITITSQGQITIPAAFRRKVGLEKSQKAMIRADEGKVVIEPIPDILALRGVFASKKKRVPFRTIRRAFEEALARGEV